MLKKASTGLDTWTKLGTDLGESRQIEAMQRHWLLRKYVNKTNPPPLHPLYETAAPETKPGKARQSPKDSAK